MRNRMAVLVLTLVPVLGVRSSAPNRSTNSSPVNDTLPIRRTVAEAEAEGAQFARTVAPPDVTSFFTAPDTGSSARRCIHAHASETGANWSVESGDFVVRMGAMRAAQATKVLWASLHDPRVAHSALMIRAASLDNTRDTMRTKTTSIGLGRGTATGRRGEWAFTSLISMPSAGR